jgi:DNA-binding IclR family transcriptional regulator
MGNQNSHSIKTVEKSFRFLEYLKMENGATLSELDSAFDLAKSTIHRHLSTLQSLGFVVKDGGTYHVSLRFFEYGEHARYRKPAYVIAESKVEELAEATGERAHFLVEEYGWVVFVHRAAGSQAVETDPGIGKTVPIHATAAGKAILAELSESDRMAILDQHDLPAYTQNTITTRDALESELQEIRNRGYSTNLQENTEGLRSVGVVVKGKLDEVIGALSVSGPTHRFQGEWFNDELPNILLGAANELELKSRHVPTSDGFK